MVSQSNVRCNFLIISTEIYIRTATQMFCGLVEGKTAQNPVLDGEDAKPYGDSKAGNEIDVSRRNYHLHT